MAAQAPWDGLEFVPGTMDEVGLKLLEAADDPQDVVAYAGYGFWAPSALIAKVSGISAQELTNGPIAPATAEYIDDSEYASRDTDEFGQPTAADGADDSTDESAPAKRSRKRAADATE